MSYAARDLGTILPARNIYLRWESLEVSKTTSGRTRVGIFTNKRTNRFDLDSRGHSASASGMLQIVDH